MRGTVTARRPCSASASASAPNTSWLGRSGSSVARRSVARTATDQAATGLCDAGPAPSVALAASADGRGPRARAASGASHPGAGAAASRMNTTISPRACSAPRRAERGEPEAPLVAEHLDVAGELGQERLEADRGVVDDDDLVGRVLGLRGDALQATQRLSRAAGERHDDRDFGGHLPRVIGRPIDSLIHTEAGHQGSPPPLSGSLDESDVVMWPARYVGEARADCALGAGSEAATLELGSPGARRRIKRRPALRKTWLAGRGRRTKRRPALRNGISP